MKTYTFRVVVEPDKDRWFAYCPALQEYGVATWGYTREEALKNINEVVQMVISELHEDGIDIPTTPSDEWRYIPATGSARPYEGNID